MQVISTYMVLVPQHMDKDGHDSSPTEGRRKEGSLAYGSQANMSHILTISRHLLTWM